MVQSCIICLTVPMTHDAGGCFDQYSHYANCQDVSRPWGIKGGPLTLPVFGTEVSNRCHWVPACISDSVFSDSECMWRWSRGT